ncbi:MAG: glycosyltransferase family 2 protein [Burkholderiaceae bacterium]
MTPPLNVVVGIATVGRREVLTETLRELAGQTRRPDRVLLCPGSEADLDRAALPSLPYPVTVVSASVGLPAQRNAILDAADAPDPITRAIADAIVFFDDDFFPARDYLARVEALLCGQPSIVVATGALLADGVHGPGIDAADARRLLAALPASPTRLDDVYNAYGCNMVIRLAPVRTLRLRFDEQLPLYAWQEDLDFSRRLAGSGRIVRDAGLTGVHLATKRGRNSGVRFGYSQVANPIYLIRKRTMHARYGATLMGKNLLSNLARSLKPEPYVDRRGRLKGNLLAIADALRGRIHPRRILGLR